jgi:hypothetical protein
MRANSNPETTNQLRSAYTQLRVTPRIRSWHGLHRARPTDLVTLRRFAHMSR